MAGLVVVAEKVKDPGSRKGLGFGRLSVLVALALSFGAAPRVSVAVLLVGQAMGLEKNVKQQMSAKEFMVRRAR